MDDKDFIDVSDDESLEMIDLDSDNEVINEIDAMLSNISIEKKENKVIENILEDKNINADKLDLYVPSKKDFNIKSAKTRKIVKKVMIYTVIFILFTFEFFLNKANNALNDLELYASNNLPIMIEKNGKYGFIDDDGDVITNAKYSYAEEFVKGYAIVKDGSNLPLIIDKAGNEVVKTGEYFSLHRAGLNIIASKVTNKGLKYGLLDSSLHKKIDFKYDNIMLQNGVLTYVLDNSVGLFNEDMKSIFNYKLSDGDDKAILVNPSIVSNEDDITYASVSVNSSSQIVNLNDGTTVGKVTLNTISPLLNNVFYETKENGEKEFYYVKDNKIVVDSINYNSMQVPSISSGALKALNKDFKYEFINTNTLDEFNKKLTLSDVYFGEDIFIYKNYNYKKAKTAFTLISNGKKIADVTGIKGIKSPFKNGMAIVIYNDNKYGYLKSDGSFLNNIHYDEASSFDSYGDAICKTKDGYGVINKSGKTILDYKYNKIKKATDKYKLNTYSDDNTIYYAASVDNYFMLYDKNGKNVNNSNYNSVSFDDTYGVVKVSIGADSKLILPDKKVEIDLENEDSKYVAYKNYIVVNKNYYNYKGKLIYISKAANEEG